MRGAGRGADASRRVTAEPFDLVLVVNLPDLGGVEAHRRLRAAGRRMTVRVAPSPPSPRPVGGLWRRPGGGRAARRHVIVARGVDSDAAYLP